MVMRLEAIRKMLEGMNLNKICKDLKIPYWQVRHVAIGRNPRYSSVEMISDYLQERLENIDRTKGEKA